MKATSLFISATVAGIALFGFTKAKNQVVHHTVIQEGIVSLSEFNSLARDVQTVNKTYTTLKDNVEKLMIETQYLKQQVLEMESFSNTLRNIVIPCLVFGGGLIAIYGMIKLIIRLRELQKRKERIILYYVNDLHFNEKIEKNICSCLDNFTNHKYKFKRVYNENQAHLTILNDDVRQREENIVPTQERVYLSIGFISKGIPAFNEIKTCRDEYGFIKMDDEKLDELITLFNKHNVKLSTSK